jgi:hypothetical protein
LRALLLCLALALPAGADLKVMRRATHIWVRISMRNTTGRWQGKLNIRCWARRTRTGPWILLREWKGLPPLGPGQKLTRELFDPSSPTLRLLTATGPVEVRSLISGTGLHLLEERSLPAQRK